jgi:oxygen-independent coproporphyrinogen-3 oxidase
MQNGNALQIKESVDAKDIAYEMLMMGLRLKDGIDIKAFNEKFDLNLEEYLNKSKLNAMINEGLVIYNQGLQIKTTEQGLYVLNSIINSILYC